jgi:hypothetical protein
MTFHGVDGGKAFEAAHGSLAEAIGMFRALGDMQRVASLLVVAAALAVVEGDAKRAALLSGAAAVLKEPLGEAATRVQLLSLDDPVPAARLALGYDAFEAADRMGRALTLDEMVLLAQAGATQSCSER